MADLTPMMKQYQRIKSNHKDAILFFRLGDFYEMFLDDAVIASRDLEITLTSRDGGNGKKIPMCGIPYHAVDGYLAKLISKGHKVAICEQVEDPKSAKGIVKREVIRIVTPGTVLESNLLNEKKQNYLLAICRGEKVYGLAYTDISTGEFYATEISGSDLDAKLFDETGRINPAECILPAAIYHEETLRSKLEVTAEGTISSKVPDEYFQLKKATNLIEKHFKITSLDALGLRELPLATCAVGAILQFLIETQKKDLQYLDQLKIYSPASFMMIDSTTRRNLELTATIRGGQRKGSLMWVCDQTVTALGGRLLREWLEKPLLDISEISFRLDGVEELTNNVFIREDLRTLLKKVYDMERLIGRIAYGSANPRDLIALKTSVSVVPEVFQLGKKLMSPLFQRMFANFDVLDDIYILIDQAINDDPPVSLREGGIIKEGYDEEVDELRSITSGGKKWIAGLESKEKAATGIKSLKVGFNKVFGYYIEVTNANLNAVPDNYIRKQTLANAERYITEELKEWENKILGASEKLTSREYELFCYARNQITLSTARIRRVAAIIAQLDVLLSFAQVALENGYCKPEVNAGDVIHIVDGRHPVVEQIAGSGDYVPNDTYLDNKEHQVCLLTGPNMAGKSTYMRQVALTVLMAQIGCFVPATSAVIGIVDRIFTRVGAADDLAGGQSTFMVEMCETANILRNATRKSLVILDEIGRGTSTYDGMSIAWAVAEYLLKPEVGAKTLFATHYHELTALADKFSQVKNYTVAVREKEGGIIFLRKIIPGGTDKSYGIQVARLAGLPEEVLVRAKEILTGLEGEEKMPKRIEPPKDRETPVQLAVFSPNPPKHPLAAELEMLDLNNLTPLDALIKLNQWQRKLKKLAGEGK
ncbi:MAG: DNA mismatch repair protein MutS [Desulfitobacteriaceae bacterium]|nr:DNA mismatch repair protein MutS [Desulfitobacteriaceae bacterium]